MANVVVCQKILMLRCGRRGMVPKLSLRGWRVTRYRSIPVEVTAVQWTGDNEAEVQALVGSRFDALAPEDREACDDPDATARIRDDAETYRLVCDGEWLLNETDPFGRILRLSDAAFRAQFEEADGR